MVNPVETVKENTDKRIVVSVVVGLVAFGVGVYALSQVKALKKVMTVVKGG